MVMNRYVSPDLLDHLSASYALGTLRHGARRRYEALARQSPTIRARALWWQGQWSGLSQLQSSSTPDPRVWARIQHHLQAERAAAQACAAPSMPVLAPVAAPSSQRASVAAAPPSPVSALMGWLDSVLLWRTFTAGASCAAIAAVAVGWGVYQQLQVSRQTVAQTQQHLLQATQTARTVQTRMTALETQLQATPQVQYVSVLHDAASSASMLVTFDLHKQQLTLQRVGSYQEGERQSLQLWALPPGAAPRSLGVLGEGAVLQLPVPEQQVKAIPTLAISLEPKGGVPSEGGPTGPVLFTGALIKRVL